MAPFFCAINIVAAHPKLLRRLADEAAVLLDLQRSEKAQVLFRNREVGGVSELFSIYNRNADRFRRGKLFTPPNNSLIKSHFN